MVHRVWIFGGSTMHAKRSLFIVRPHLQFLCDLVEDLTQRNGGITSTRRFLIDSDGAPLIPKPLFSAHQVISDDGIRSASSDQEHFLRSELDQITLLLEAGAYDEGELDILENRACQISKVIIESLGLDIEEEEGMN